MQNFKAQLRGFLMHVKRFPGATVSYRDVAGDWEGQIPQSLSRWLRTNGGGFEFNFGVQIDGSVRGGLSILPAGFPQLQNDIRSWAEDTWIAEELEEQKKWLGSFAFAELENGDFLALQTELNLNDPPVIYLAHDDVSEIIAPSLDAYFKTWSELCFVGPEIWIIQEFLDRSTGHLNSSSDKADALRLTFAL